jgi:hypothetical protein
MFDKDIPLPEVVENPVVVKLQQLRDLGEVGDSVLFAKEEARAVRICMSLGNFTCASNEDGTLRVWKIEPAPAPETMAPPVGPTVPTPAPVRD